MATLTLTKTSGLNLLHNVSDDLGQISCGMGCSSDTGTYPVGTIVVLTAEPGLLRFRGWSGACTGTATTCTVTMTGNKSVHATFSLLFADEATARVPAQWTSLLDAPAAAGNVTVGGVSIAGVGRAPARIDVPQGAEVRVGGVLATGTGPGSWRFERQPGAGRQVRLKVIEGQVALVTPDAIVFRLRGQPGERVGFAIVPVP